MTEYYIWIVLVFAGVGLTKGLISGRGISRRFPKSKKTALVSSIFLMGLFTAAAVTSLSKAFGLREQIAQEGSSGFSIESFLNEISSIDFLAVAIGLVLPGIILFLAQSKIKGVILKILRGTTIFYYVFYGIYILGWVPGDESIGLLVVFQLNVVFGVAISTGFFKNV